MALSNNKLYFIPILILFVGGISAQSVLLSETEEIELMIIDSLTKYFVVDTIQGYSYPKNDYSFNFHFHKGMFGLFEKKPYGEENQGLYLSDIQEISFYKSEEQYKVLYIEAQKGFGLLKSFTSDGVFMAIKLKEETPNSLGTFLASTLNFLAKINIDKSAICQT